MRVEGIVKSLKLLTKLEKAGHITLHPHTGTIVYWNGSKGRAWYIDDYTNRSFTHQGKEYLVKYHSGSFYPYVYRISEI